MRWRSRVTADVVGLTAADRQQLWGYAIVQPYALEGSTRR
jgi:hypothetical protein